MCYFQRFLPQKGSLYVPFLTHFLVLFSIFAKKTDLIGTFGLFRPGLPKMTKNGHFWEDVHFQIWSENSRLDSWEAFSEVQCSEFGPGPEKGIFGISQTLPLFGLGQISQISVLRIWASQY